MDVSAWDVACSDVVTFVCGPRVGMVDRGVGVGTASSELRVGVVSRLGLFFLVCGDIYLTGQYLHEAM
jgi:hypothetical protein